MKSLLVVLGLAVIIGVESAEIVKNEGDAGAAAEAEPEAAAPTRLNCFVCNSKIDPECADDFDKTNEALIANFGQECNAKEGGSVYCKKVKMWFDLNGETRIERSCGHSKREYKEPCFQSRADDHVVDTCQCEDGDGYCNGTPYLAAPGAFAVVVAALVALRA